MNTKPSSPVIICFPDTEESQRFVAFLAKYNLPCILVGSRKWLEVPDYKNIITKVNFENIKNDNIDEVYIKLSHIISLNNLNIFLCISFSETLVEITASLNKYFNCWGIYPEQAELFRDKYLMRKKTIDMGLKSPLFTLATSLTDRSVFYKNMEEICKQKKKPFTILSKPRKAWGCIGIKKFTTIQEVENYCNKNERFLDEILLEEYIEGTMHHVGSVVCNSKTFYNVTINYFYPVLELGKKASYNLRVYATDQKSDFSEKLKNYQNQILDNFSLPIGMTECECIQEKETGNIYLCEIACRHSAVNVTRLYSAIMDLDPFEMLTLLIKNKLENKNIETCQNAKWNSSYAGIISFSSPSGYVSNITDIESFDSPEIIWKKKNLKEGLLKSECNFINCLGQIIVKTSNEQQCIDLLTEYDRLFSYQITPITK